MPTSTRFRASRTHRAHLNTVLDLFVTGCVKRLNDDLRPRSFLPLPGGEGRGEGERYTNFVPYCLPEPASFLGTVSRCARTRPGSLQSCSNTPKTVNIRGQKSVTDWLTILPRPFWGDHDARSAHLLSGTKQRCHRPCRQFTRLRFIPIGPVWTRAQTPGEADE
jgi:hypothetical protein